MSGNPIPTPIDPGMQSLVKFAQEDLSRRQGIATSQIELISAEPVTWPDGGLGCPQPGMLYPQVQVDGVLIRLRARGNVYEYHSGGGKPPFLCEK